MHSVWKRSVFAALRHLLYDIPVYCSSFRKDLCRFALSLSLTSAIWVCVTKVNQQTRFSMFIFPLCLNCFTDFHITHTADAGHPNHGCNYSGLFKQFCFEVMLNQEHTLLNTERHVVYCLRYCTCEFCQNGPSSLIYDITNIPNIGFSF
jgi:hypothetical protein